MVHSCIVHKHQLRGYRWPGLLSQMAFCQPCKAMLVHYRSCWVTGEGLSELVVFQTATNDCLDLSCNLCTFLSPTERIGLMAGRARLQLVHPPLISNTCVKTISKTSSEYCMAVYSTYRATLVWL